MRWAKLPITTTITVTHSYVDLCATTEARKDNLAAHGFVCDCPRCVDGLVYHSADVDAALTSAGLADPVDRAVLVNQVQGPTDPPPYRRVRCQRSNRARCRHFSRHGHSFTSATATRSLPPRPLARFDR